MTDSRIQILVDLAKAIETICLAVLQKDNGLRMLKGKVFHVRLTTFEIPAGTQTQVEVARYPKNSKDFKPVLDVLPLLDVADRAQLLADLYTAWPICD